MFKAVFVDDEIWALKGLSKMFDWESLGFRVVGEFTKSTEALKVILENKPDVVFVDIRMPVISGIELMKKAREHGLKTEFIIVSGFSEFEYAREAIKYGAFDYCLKPVETAGMKTLVDRLIPHLRKKREQESLSLYEELAEAKDNTCEILRKKGLEQNCPYYQVLLILQPEEGQFNVEIQYSFITLNFAGNKTMYIVNTDKSIREELEDKVPDNAVIGLSSLHEFPVFSQMFAEADIAAHNTFIYKDLRFFEYMKTSNVLVNSIVDVIFINMEKNNVPAIEKTVRGLPEFFAEKRLQLNDLVYLWNQVVAYVSKSYPNETESSEFEFMDYQQLIYQHKSFEDFTNYLLDELTYLIDRDIAGDRGFVTSTANADFNRLLEYISEHYNERLLLKELADRFYLHKNYCCYLFKKYLGCTFSEYLNRIRTEKSKELLGDVNYSIEQIAEAVGYNDYFYYNRVFKKKYGITPSQYRKKVLSGR